MFLHPFIRSLRHAREINDTLPAALTIGSDNTGQANSSFLHKTEPSSPSSASGGPKDTSNRVIDDHGVTFGLDGAEYCMSPTTDDKSWEVPPWAGEDQCTASQERSATLSSAVSIDPVTEDTTPPLTENRKRPRQQGTSQSTVDGEKPATKIRNRVKYGGNVKANLNAEEPEPMKENDSKE